MLTVVVEVEEGTEVEVALDSEEVLAGAARSRRAPRGFRPTTPSRPRTPTSRKLYWQRAPPSPVVEVGETVLLLQLRGAPYRSCCWTTWRERRRRGTRRRSWECWCGGGRASPPPSPPSPPPPLILLLLPRMLLLLLSPTLWLSRGRGRGATSSWRWWCTGRWGAGSGTEESLLLLLLRRKPPPRALAAALLPALPPPPPRSLSCSAATTQTTSDAGRPQFQDKFLQHLGLLAAALGPTLAARDALVAGIAPHLAGLLLRKLAIALQLARAAPPLADGQPTPPPRMAILPLLPHPLLVEEKRPVAVHVLLRGEAGTGKSALLGGGRGLPRQARGARQRRRRRGASGGGRDLRGRADRRRREGPGDRGVGPGARGARAGRRRRTRARERGNGGREREEARRRRLTFQKKKNLAKKTSNQADGGLCALDGLDALPLDQRGTLHEAMEQQSVSVGEGRARRDLADEGVRPRLGRRAAENGKSGKMWRRRSRRRLEVLLCDARGPAVCPASTWSFVMRDPRTREFDESVCDAVLGEEEEEEEEEDDEEGNEQGNNNNNNSNDNAAAAPSPLLVPPPGPSPLAPRLDPGAGAGVRAVAPLPPGPEPDQGGREGAARGLPGAEAAGGDPLSLGFRRGTSDFFGGSSGSNSAPVGGNATIRHLESLARVAVAHARLVGREEAGAQDAVVAVALAEAAAAGGSGDGSGSGGGNDGCGGGGAGGNGFDPSQQFPSSSQNKPSSSSSSFFDDGGGGIGRGVAGLPAFDAVRSRPCARPRRRLGRGGARRRADGREGGRAGAQGGARCLCCRCWSRWSRVPVRGRGGGGGRRRWWRWRCRLFLKKKDFDHFFARFCDTSRASERRRFLPSSSAFSRSA